MTSRLGWCAGAWCLGATLAAAGCGSGGGGECSGICGCTVTQTVTVATRVVDSMGNPLAGITLTCGDELKPFATSDSEGKIAFSVDSEVSSGCGSPRCYDLRFDDPSGVHASRKMLAPDANDGDVVMPGGGAGAGGGGGT